MKIETKEAKLVIKAFEFAEKAHKGQYRHVDGDTSTITVLDKEEPLAKEMREFVDCIVNGSECVSGGALGVDVVRTIEEI